MVVHRSASAYVKSFHYHSGRSPHPCGLSWNPHTVRPGDEGGSKPEPYPVIGTGTAALLDNDFLIFDGCVLKACSSIVPCQDA